MERRETKLVEQAQTDDMSQSGKVLVYIDNSNIFINTKKHLATKKKFITSIQQDFRGRVDVGKLVTKARKGREILYGKLYGSEPPALDSVWEKIREDKIEVYVFKRSDWTNKEKATDTGLVADAVEDIIVHKQEAENGGAVLLFTGDLDMLPVLRKAVKYGWKVEIWSYSFSLSEELRRESKNNDKVAIHHIEDCFDEVTMFVNHWSAHVKIPAERSVVLRFDLDESLVDSKEEFVADVVKKADQVFRMPTLGQFVTSDKIMDLILVFPPETKKDGSIVYSFNEAVWKKVEEFKDCLRNCEAILTYSAYQKRMPEVDWERLKQLQRDEDMDLDSDDPSIADTCFEVVRPPKKKRPKQESEKCTYGFQCSNGLLCKFGHSYAEKDFFNEQPNAKLRFLYKTKPCTRKNNCRYLEKAYLCCFAHNPREARCVTCKNVGHWSYACPDAQTKK